MSEISENEIKSMTKEQNYMRGYSDGKQDILEKIRDEILKLDDPDYDFEGYYKAVTDTLAIIDKYREESDCRECKAEHDCYECEKYAKSEEEKQK